jgi:hypothetical protein
LQVPFDVGEILHIRDRQAVVRLLHRGLRRVVVRPVAGRGGCALVNEQRQGGGREPGRAGGR